MLVAPILLAVSMWAITGRALSLLMAAASPMMMFGNFISQKTNLGQRLRKEVDSFEEQFERLEERLYHAHPREREVRHNEVPAVAVVFDEAMRLGPLLWTRRPEHWNFLSLRLGVSTDEARTRIKRTDAPRGPRRGSVERVDRLEERYKMIDDVPILESLQGAGLIGVAGPTSLASDALRGLAVQLFGMHSPNELVAVALTEPGWANELDWLKWLPHTSSERNPFKDVPLADSASTGTALLSGLEELVMRRAKAATSPRPPYGDDWDPMLYGTDVKRASEEASFPGQTAVLVIVTNDAPVDRARLARIFSSGERMSACTRCSWRRSSRHFPPPAAASST